MHDCRLCTHLTTWLVAMADWEGDYCRKRKYEQLFLVILLKNERNSWSSLTQKWKDLAGGKVGLKNEGRTLPQWESGNSGPGLSAIIVLSISSHTQIVWLLMLAHNTTEIKTQWHRKHNQSKVLLFTFTTHKMTSLVFNCNQHLKSGTNRDDVLTLGSGFFSTFT